MNKHTKMKTVTVFFTIILLIGVGSLKAQDNSVWKELAFKNYTIKYPSNKKLEKSSQEGSFTLYLIPEKLPSQSDNVLMQINDIAGYMLDLESYAYQFGEAYFNYYNVTVLEDQEVTINNKPCHIFVTEKDDGHGTTEYKTRVYIWVKNNWAYNLIFSAKPDRYDKLLPIAEKMAESFAYTK